MKTTITAHMALTKAQRQAHTNTSSACIPARNKYTDTLQLNTNKHKQALLAELNIEPFDGTQHKIHTIHMCNNDTTAPNGFICINPEHLFFGTRKENFAYKSKEKRGAALNKAIKNGNHVNQQKRKCIYCGFVSNPPNIGRYHNENCKHKPFTKE